jgi:hypothetical protein
MRRPNYAAIPSLSEDRLVVDLDRIMTVEKSVLALWEHTKGCQTDLERKDFAQALIRKVGRAAFPDDFVELMKNISNHLSNKHGKNSPEGEALRSLREIRVKPLPDWGAKSIELQFYFIKDDKINYNIDDKDMEKWLNLIVSQGKYITIRGVILNLSEMMADDYIYSYSLDLDNLSRKI